MLLYDFEHRHMQGACVDKYIKGVTFIGSTFAFHQQPILKLNET